MRRSNRTTGALVLALVGVSVLLAPIRTATADETPAGGDIVVAPPAEPDPSLADLGVTDSLIERPGFKWWAIDTAVISSVTWGATLAFNSNIRNGVMDSSGQQWLDNISSAPEWNDGSDALTNYFAHPMLGATWFMAYRSRGHGFVASSLGLMFQSIWLEYIIESPHNIPSWHDMLFTPLIGIPLGYGLDTLSVYLLKKEEPALHYLGYLFNPFHLLPSAKKYRWNVSIDPANKSFAISGRF